MYLYIYSVTHSACLCCIYYFHCNWTGIFREKLYRCVFGNRRCRYCSSFHDFRIVFWFSISIARSTRSVLQNGWCVLFLFTFYDVFKENKYLTCWWFLVFVCGSIHTPINIIYIYQFIYARHKDILVHIHFYVFFVVVKSVEM